MNSSGKEVPSSSRERRAHSLVTEETSLPAFSTPPSPARPPRPGFLSPFYRSPSGRRRSPGYVWVTLRPWKNLIKITIPAEKGGGRGRGSRGWLSGSGNYRRSLVNITAGDKTGPQVSRADISREILPGRFPGILSSFPGILSGGLVTPRVDSYERDARDARRRDYVANLLRFLLEGCRILGISASLIKGLRDGSSLQRIFWISCLFTSPALRSNLRGVR